MVINMKRLLYVLVLLPLASHAGQITMTNPEEEQTENGKTLCTYQNSNYLFTYVNVPIRKPSIQWIRKSEKGRRANHQLYLVWCYGVRLYAGSKVCRDDDTASPVTNKP